MRPLDRNILLTELALEKRPMFEYEQEVRIIDKTPEPSPDPGHTLRWEPEKSLEYVYVHPDADRVFFETVRGIVTKYAPLLAERVRWSAMQFPPPF